ncbi:MAG: transglutaminase-like domain-containing protein [Candidatus Firestonebacteria bacterium]
MYKLKAYCIAILFLAPLFGDTYPIFQYFNVLINNSKVGYSSVIIEKSKYNDVDCLKETEYMLFEINRFESKIKMETRAELFYTEKLAPLGFKAVETMSGQEKVIEGSILNNKLFLTVKLAGAVERKELVFPADTIFDDMVDDKLRLSPLVGGSSLKIKIFDKSNLKFTDVKVKVLGAVKEEINGKEVAGFSVEAEMYGVSSFHVVDENGLSLKSSFPQMGMVSVKTTEEDAKKAFSTGVDILADFTIKSNKSITDPKMVKEMNCSIIFTDGLPAAFTEESIKNTSIRILKDNMAICTLRREVFDETKAVLLPIKEKSARKYLKATPYEQSEDPLIKNTAAGIIGQEKNSYKAAGLIIHWVNKVLKKKADYNVAFDTAKETIIKKEGDCTEHSVLASALCKAAGIPTKICGGIVPVYNVFLYHMWLEIYTGNDKWVPMDPTFDEVILDASHIKISEGVLDDEGKFKLMLDILSYFKKVEVQVFKLEYMQGER